MKKSIFFVIILLSQTIWANVLNWNDLEPNQKYSLAFDIQLDENLSLKADSPLYFNSASDLGSIPVILFNFSNPNCTDQDLESEMVLFNPEPEDTINDKSIGIQFSKNCTVDIYIESGFYYDKSILKL